MNVCVQVSALHGNDATVSFLLSKGADPLARSSHGSTALEFAESFGRTACVATLRPIVQRVEHSLRRETTAGR